MKKRNFLAVLASCAVVASMFPMTVGAVGSNYSGLTTETIANADGDAVSISKNTMPFDKYLVMDVNANVPNAAFNFAIAKYDDTKADREVIKDADSTHLAVLNGISNPVFTVDSTKTGSNTAGEVKFVQADKANTVTEGAASADTAVVWNDATSGNEKYAKKTLTLDFGSVGFDEPGVYRYLITETGDNQGVANDTGVTGEAKNTYRTLDVYVEDYAGYYANLSAEDQKKYPVPTADKKLLITSYVMYNGKNDAAPSKDGDNTVEKSTSYTNTYTSYDLTFSKTVTGNQGSKDKYFAFTLTIENAVPNTVYDISYADDGNDNTTDGNADVSISANPNSATTVITKDVTQPATITVGADGTVTQVFYLQNGQSIAVRGLAKDTKYTVVDGKEDYVASYTTDDTNDTANEKTDTAANTTGIAQDVTVNFTNNRQGTIPTGVILSVAAPVVIGLAVLGGIIFLVIRNKKRDAEEEE